MSDPGDTTFEVHAGRVDGIRVGARLGRHQLERELGRGGMGEVFAARDLESGELVALKTLAKPHPTLRYRFKREFRALADVEHPNLIRLGELFVSESGPSYFTMELIEGCSFTSWVRGSTPVGELPDLERLEAALRQLVEGLEGLHAHQCVHRDVKPSNVLVNAAGRVVILDFGIIAESSDTAPGMTIEGQLLGTPIYMAPEQAMATAAGTASDFYAVGVILYECLTGRVPFSGPSLQMLLDKQDGPTPDPRADVAEVPAKLRDLCVRLLHRDPARRPSGPEILDRLMSLGERAGAPTLIRRRATEVPFVGRERELEQLRGALVDVRDHHQAVSVYVRGRSGHGKSALVQHFIAEAQHSLADHQHVRADSAELLILRGRCRERETVPYKGVDAVVDALSAYLRRIGDDERRALRPRYIGALARIFPALDEIWTRDERERLDLDPNETRGLGWAALREVLSALARRVALVVLIDDFQWTDLDSVAILRATIRQPDAPALLLLVTARDEVADPGVRAWLDDDDDAREVRRIELGPLPESDARELALTLLRAQQRAGPRAEAIALGTRADAVALRCAGSPFFIGQMVLGGDATNASIDLDQIVVRRLAQLEGPARQVVEVVAVAGGPMAQALVVELARSSDAQVDELCGLRLLVRSETGDRVEAAHDRIRELALAGLSPERLASLHWALGERLLASRELASGELVSDESMPAGDAVFEIVDHLDAGLASVEQLGDERRLELARLNLVAGERALGSAAWASARRYLGLGFELVEPWLSEARRGQGGPTRALCLAIGFGRAQAEGMGLSELAGPAFEDLLAWSLSEVEVGQIVARRVAMLSWQSRLDESIDLGLAGLARLGQTLPRSPPLARGLVEVLLGWLTLGRRDLETLCALPELRDEGVRARLDVLVEVGFAAPYLSPPLMLALAGYCTRTVARYGYHGGLCRALTQLGLALHALGKSRAAAALCDRALQLAERRDARPLDKINARTLAQFMVWPSSRSLRGLLVDFEERVLEACDFGAYFEAGYISVAGGFYSLESDRPLAELRAQLERFEARNPSHGGAINQPGFAVVRRQVDTLIDGRPPMTSEEVGDAIALIRYMGIIAEVVMWMLLGDYERATSRMDQMPRDYLQVLIGVVQVPRFAVHSAILEARRCPARGRGRRRTIRRIRAHARVVGRWAKHGPENFGPMAAIIEGELAALLGRPERAVEAFERARAGARSNGALSLVALASLRLAVLARDRGHALTAEAAFAAAIADYEAWGASAVVAGLRERGLAGA